MFPTDVIMTLAPMAPQEALRVHQAHWEKLAAADLSDADWLILADPIVEAHDGRPLLVWVHPGDACESDHPRASIQEQAWALEERMGKEILERLPTHRVVVVHRTSSAFAFEPHAHRVAPAYANAMATVCQDPTTASLWGDDLDALAGWIADRRGAAPGAFLTGAWNHPDHGCVSAVGQALLAQGWPVTVSPHSPSEPGSVNNAWRPAVATRRRAPR